MKILLLALCIMLYSCKCEYHLRKAKEGGCLANDTVILRDTLIGFSVDTVVQFDTMSFTDTLTIEKDGVRSTTVIRWKERLVTQEITKKDTIFKREHFTVKEIKTVEKIPWWVYLVFCLGGVVILGLVFKGK